MATEPTQGSGFEDDVTAFQEAMGSGEIIAEDVRDFKSAWLRSQEEDRLAAEEEAKRKPTLGGVANRALLSGASGALSGVASLASGLEAIAGGPAEDPEWLPRRRVPDRSKPSMGRRIVESLRTRAEEYEEASQTLGGGVTGDIVAGLSSSLAASAPTILAGGTAGAVFKSATKALPAIAAVAGVQSFGDMRESGADILQQRIPNLSREDALTQAEAPAAVAGAITGALTAFAGRGTERLAGRLGEMIARRGKDAVRQSIRQSLIREASKEIPEEMADQLAQGIIERVSLNPDKPWSEIAVETAFAGLGGFTTAGAVGTVGSLAGKAMGIPTEEEAAPTIGHRVRYVYPDTGEVRSGRVVHTFEDDGMPFVKVARTGADAEDGQYDYMPYGQVQDLGDIQEGGEERVGKPKRKRRKAEEPAQRPDVEAPADSLTVLRPVGVTEGDQVATPRTSAPPAVSAPEPETDEEAPILADDREPVGPGHLDLVAYDFIARIAGMGESAPIVAQARAERLRQLISQPKRNRSTRNQIAQILNLRFDPGATRMPSLYRYLEQSREPSAQESAALQQESSLPAAATEPKVDPVPVALTARQRARYQGGQVVYLQGQEERGPLEVIEQTPKRFDVMELSTGRRYKVALSRVTLGRPANVESRSVKRADAKARQRVQRAESEQAAADAQASRRAGALESAAQDDVAAAAMHQDVALGSPRTSAPPDPQPVDPGAIQSGATASEGNVSYDPPVDRRDAFLVRMLAAVVDRMNRSLPGVRIRRLQYFSARPGESPIAVAPSATGMDTILVDPFRLAIESRELTPEQLLRFLEAAAREEVAHIASGLAILEEWQRYGGEAGTGMTFDRFWREYHHRLYRDMTADQVEATLKAYGSLSPDDHVGIAAEFVRGVEQRMLGGETTEESLGDRIVEFLRQWMSVLERMVQGIRSGTMQSLVVDHILAIDRILKQQDLVRATSRSNVVERSGRRLGARLTRRSDREVADFNAQVLSPEQIELIHTSGYIQGQAVLGRARAQWEQAPDEVKGRLLDLRERFENLDVYAERIGAEENDTRSLEEMLSTVPEEERPWMSRDASEAFHSFVEVQYQADQKLRAAHDALTKAITKADSADADTKRGVTELKRQIVRRWKDALIARQKEAVAKKQDTGNIKASIAQAQRLEKENSVALRRVAAALFENPDPNLLDPKSLGLSPEITGQLKRMAIAMGKEEIDRVRSRPLEPLQREYNEAKDVVDFLTGIASDPDWQADLRYAYEAEGVEFRVLTESKTEWKIRDPYGETDEDGNVRAWTIVFDMDRGIDGDNKERAIDAAIRLEEFIEDPGAHPGMVAHARSTLARLYLWMNPHFEAGSPHLVGTDINIWNVIHRAIPALSNPDSRLGFVPTRMANLAMQALRNMDQMEAVVSQLWREAEPEIVRTARIAAKKHGMDPVRWSQTVLNRLLASWNSPYAPRVHVGDRVGGIVISEEDMQAARLQHDAFVARLFSRLREHETVQNRAFPLKVSEETRVIPIDRYAGATSPLTMPQKMRAETRDYINAWKEASSLDIDARRAALFSVLGGTRSDAFVQVAIGHCTSCFYSADYARANGVSDEERVLYRNISMSFDHDPNDAPSGIDELVDLLFDEQKPDKHGNLRSRDEVADRFFGQIARALHRADTEASQYWGANDTSKRVQIIRVENFLTQPRTGLHLPIGLYDYTATTPASQWQILHASYEVYGQRYADALTKVQTELNRYLSNIKDRIGRMRAELEQAGKVKPSRAGKVAVRTVKRQTQEELRTGQSVFDYTMAHRILIDVNTSLEMMDGIAQSNNDYFNEQTGLWRPFFSTVRGVLTQNHLSRPIVAQRNRIGGTLRIIQTKAQMGYAARPILNSMPQAFLGVKLTSGARVAQSAAGLTHDTGAEMAKTGAAFLKWALGNGYISEAILSRPGVKKYIEDNQGELNLVMGYLVRYLQGTAEEWSNQRYLGLTGSGKMASQAANLWALKWSGGKIREEDQTAGTVAVRFLESVLGSARLFGGVPPTGLLAPWQVKSVALVTADHGANIAAANYAMETVQKAKMAALEYLAAREDLGILNASTRLSPQELTGNPLADERMATFTRTLWSKAGINIDGAMLDYYFRVKQADANDEPRDSVPFLTLTQWNSLQMLMVEEINRAGFVNRPENFHRTELGRWMSLYFGYTFWHMGKFAEARARVSTQAKGPGSFVRGNWQVATMLLATLLVGWVDENVTRALAWWLYNERRQNKDNLKQDNAVDIARAFLEDAAPFLPLQFSIANEIANRTVRPGTGVGPNGIAFVPLSALNDSMQTITDIVQTKSAVQPAFRFLKRFAPSLKVVANRLPSFRGNVRLNNVQRAIRDAIPSSMEYRRVDPSNRYVKSTSSDNKANISNALNTYNGPDWDLVDYQRDLAVDEMLQAGHENPEQSIDDAILDRTPMRSVLGRLPTSEERETILGRMDEEWREELLTLESYYSEYAGRYGRAQPRLVSDEVRTVRPSASPPPRRATVERFANPYLRDEERERVGSPRR